MPTAWLADREWHAQFVTVGLAAQLMQWPQYRPLLPIIEAMETRYGWTTADDYRLFFHMPFLALVHGWNLAAGWHHKGAPYYAALQQTCGFEKGECLVVHSPPPPQPHRRVLRHRPGRRGDARRRRHHARENPVRRAGEAAARRDGRGDASEVPRQARSLQARRLSSGKSAWGRPGELEYVFGVVSRRQSSGSNARGDVRHHARDEHHGVRRDKWRAECAESRPP